MPQQAAHKAHREGFPAWVWVLHHADDQEVEGFIKGLKAAAKLDEDDIHFQDVGGFKIEEIDPQKGPYKQCPNPDAWITASVYWTPITDTVQTVAAKTNSGHHMHRTTEVNDQNPNSCVPFDEKSNYP